MAVIAPMSARDAVREVNRLYPRLQGRLPEIQKHERYMEGEQRLAYATSEWKEKNGARFSEFSDNWCAPIVEAESERIEFAGIDFGKDAPEGAGELVQRWGIDNELELGLAQGVDTALVNRRTYVIVWSDAQEDGKPYITFEHPENVVVEYDPSDFRRRRSAIKVWRDERFEFSTLYTPDFIYKFKRENSKARNERDEQVIQLRAGYDPTGGWIGRSEEAWVIPNPLGAVPVVELPNRKSLRGNPKSEIERVIPLQDAVNLLWVYLMHAGDYASMPARVLLGSNPPMRPVLNSKGEVIGSKPITMKELQEARLAVFKDKDAKIDSWPEANLLQFTEVIEIAIGHIAAQTRTPPHYLVTNKGLANLAADALKAAEIGLVKKAIEFEKHASPAMREIHRLAALVAGENAVAEAVRYSTVAWGNAEMRSESQMSDALLKKSQVGYPFEYLMEVDGIDPLNRTRILEMKEREEAARQRAALAALQGVADYDASQSGGELPTAADNADAGNAQPDRAPVGGGNVRGHSR